MYTMLKPMARLEGINSYVSDQEYKSDLQKLTTEWQCLWHLTNEALTFICEGFKHERYTFHHCMLEKNQLLIGYNPALA